MGFDWSIVVEVAKKSEKLRQGISIIKISIEVRILVEDGDEYSHDVGKNSNSDQ